MTSTILQIDSSGRTSDSLSRQVTAYLTQKLSAKDHLPVVQRDLSKTPLEFVTEAHIGAYYTKKEDRTEQQNTLLTLSDGLIGELKAAKKIVIGAPIYNFSVPAALKAWIDLVCRVGETFVYGNNGPQGLLSNVDEAFIVVSAGGTPVGSEIDFNSTYLKHVCRFVGIENIHIIDVSGSKRDPETLLDFAKEQVDKLRDETVTV